MPETLADEPSPAQEGATLSKRYRIVRPLGQGAIGRVYEVVHLGVGRRFAAKVLKSEYCESAQVRERFRREAKVGGKLRSPYAVEVVDYGESEGAPYFVMEYLEGETLQALVAREGPLPVRRAATLLVHACRGVRAAHALGVLHRDLKPSNLFVAAGERGELCKVLDFGIAKATESHPSSSLGPETSTGAVIGTLQYMPPEQLRSQRDLDERVDVYALGSILYECLSGARAFEAPTPSALMYKILEESAAPLATLRSGLPPSLIACVERAMLRDRDARTASVEELERQLLPFAAQQDALLAQATAAGTGADELVRLPGRELQRGRRTALVFAATAALAVPFAAWFGYRAGVSAAPSLPTTPAAAAALPEHAPAAAIDTARNAEPTASPSSPPAAPPPAASSSVASRLPASSAQRLDSRARERRPRTPEPPVSSAPAGSASEARAFDRRNPYRLTP
jgi:eukaryotic-like serine/threonine-protein kinase